MKDNINPNHYKGKNGLEAIDVMESFVDGMSGPEAICTGNVIKYILRWPKKNGLEDLKKVIRETTKNFTEIKGFMYSRAIDDFEGSI